MIVASTALRAESNPSPSLLQSTEPDALVEEFLTAGDLCRRYKDTNKHEPSVQKITHHGMIHIAMVHQVAKAFGPFLGFNRDGTKGLDELATIELGCLLHDIGLSRGRSKHAANGAALVEEILTPYGVDSQISSIVRQLVRWHRADDFVALDERILPRSAYILQALERGVDLGNLVDPLDAAEDPTGAEVAEFLRLEASGIPMVRMLALEVLADVIDIGRSRVRKERRTEFHHWMKVARKKRNTTLEDVLIGEGIEYSGFDLANYAITRLEAILQDENQDTIASILIQEEESRPRSKGKTHHCCNGLFSWAHSFSHLQTPEERRLAFQNIPSWLRINPHAGKPAFFVFRMNHDREVCSLERVEEIKHTYLGALKAAARLLGLEPIQQISANMEY